MVTVDGGVLVGRVLQEQGVKYLFAINGGHTFPILANLREHGIKLIHMRHEQATAYAADGWARTHGHGRACCCVTAGCGLTNAVTGLCVAGPDRQRGRLPLGPAPDDRGRPRLVPGSLRLARSAARSAKFTHRVLDWSRIGFDLRHGVPRGA